MRLRLDRRVSRAVDLHSTVCWSSSLRNSRACVVTLDIGDKVAGLSRLDRLDVLEISVVLGNLTSRAKPGPIVIIFMGQLSTVVQRTAMYDHININHRMMKPTRNPTGVNRIWGGH